MPYSKKQALIAFHSGCARYIGIQRWSSSTRMMP